MLRIINSIKNDEHVSNVQKSHTHDLIKTIWFTEKSQYN